MTEDRLMFAKNAAIMFLTAVAKCNPKPFWLRPKSQNIKFCQFFKHLTTMQKEFDVYVRKIVTELNSKNEPISKGVKKVFLGKFKADHRNEAIQKAALQSGYSMNCNFRAYEQKEPEQTQTA